VYAAFVSLFILWVWIVLVHELVSQVTMRGENLLGAFQFMVPPPHIRLESMTFNVRQKAREASSQATTAYGVASGLSSTILSSGSRQMLHGERLRSCAAGSIHTRRQSLHSDLVAQQQPCVLPGQELAIRRRSYCRKRLSIDFHNSFLLIHFSLIGAHQIVQKRGC
jgi:hypothetical protein